MKKITDDVIALQPTLFIAVPRVLERIQSGIAGKVAHKGLLTNLLFNAAYWYKSMRIRFGATVESVCAPPLHNDEYDIKTNVDTNSGHC